MFLGIDLGTSSVKALLLSEEGSVIKEASEPYLLNAAQLGWAETHPQDWWQATCKVVKTVCKENPPQAISFSGQMHGSVLSNAQGQAIRPAILWADTRSSVQLKQFERLSLSQRLALANPVVVGMMASSLLWLKEHEPDSYKQAFWAVQPKDWLRFQFTHDMFTDPSDASATLLYNLIEDNWAFDSVAELGLRADFLAPLKASSEAAGFLTKQAAEALGLPAGIAVITGGADAACSAFGSNLRQAGQAQINIGTAMQIFAIRDTPEPDKDLKTHLYRTVETNYYAMAAMQNAGIAFEWVRKILGVSWPEMYQEAFSIASTEGLLFLPYLTGERTPHMNPDAKGTWHGLSLKHERKHLIRACFEGIAFALKAGLNALEDTGIKPSSLRLAGGGSNEASWQQLIADSLKKDLYQVNVASSSAKGAALLAARGIGKDILQTQTPTLVAKAQPNEELEQRYTDFCALYRNLY